MSLFNLNFSLLKTLRVDAVTKQLLLNQVRHHNKHWNPKFKRLRALKVIQVDLPEFDEARMDYDDYTDETVTRKLQKLGMQPVRPWHERPMYVASTTSIYEPYLPPEGDGKVSSLNTAGAKQKIEWLKKKKDTWQALKKIRKYDDDFEPYPDFIDLAEEVYKNAHTALAEDNKEKLIEYATEKAYIDMLNNADRKTIRWKYLKALEAPRIAHIRTNSLLEDNNVYAQITVRFHTQQVLAIYDRFGRLLYGSEILAKDVLEYVVFEKHVINAYGKWRVHGKIIPEWLPPREPAVLTYAEPSSNISQLTTVDQLEPEIVQPLVSIPEKES